jgi:hypothetical protein
VSPKKCLVMPINGDPPPMKADSKTYRQRQDRCHPLRIQAAKHLAVWTENHGKGRAEWR